MINNEKIGSIELVACVRRERKQLIWNVLAVQGK